MTINIAAIAERLAENSGLLKMAEDLARSEKVAKGPGDEQLTAPNPSFQQPGGDWTPAGTLGRAAWAGAKAHQAVGFGRGIAGGLGNTTPGFGEGSVAKATSALAGGTSGSPGYQAGRWFGTQARRGAAAVAGGAREQAGRGATAISEGLAERFGKPAAQAVSKAPWDVRLRNNIANFGKGLKNPAEFGMQELPAAAEGAGARAAEGVGAKALEREAAPVAERAVTRFGGKALGGLGIGLGFLASSPAQAAQGIMDDTSSLEGGRLENQALSARPAGRQQGAFYLPSGQVNPDFGKGSPTPAPSAVPRTGPFRNR